MNLYRRYKEARNYDHPESPRYLKNDLNYAPPGTERIKIITYNTDFSANIDKAISLLRNNEYIKDADIICLQEADHTGVEKIGGILGYNYVYYPAVIHPGHNRDFGNAVLSKYEISKDKKVILNPEIHHHFNRIAVGAEIRFGNINIVIYSIHMKVFMRSAETAVQLSTLLKSSGLTGDNVIIAGDFNCYTRARIDTITGSFGDMGFIHTTGNIEWSFRKWYTFHKKYAVDHIFTKGFAVMKSGTVEYPRAHDHLPVWAELEVTC